MTCRSSVYYPAGPAPLARETYTPRSGNVYRRTPALERFVQFLNAKSETSADWLLNRAAHSSAA